MMVESITFAGDFRIAQLRFVDEAGNFYRDCRAPGDDLSDLPKEVQEAIASEWVVGVADAYRDATKEIALPPEPSREPDRIAALEARLAQMELRADRIEADVISELAVKA